MSVKKKLIALILTLILTPVVGGGTVVYAFFNISGGEAAVNAEASLTGAQGGVIAVANAPELIAAAADSSYNPSGEVSSERKTLRFTSDITLNSELNITADVNIDFAGYSLVTGGNRVKVRHFYSGVFDLYNGAIVGGGAEVIEIYTPNAFVATDTLTLIGISVNARAFDDNEVIDSVIAIIADRIAGGGRYTSISDDITLNKNRYCARHGAAQHDGGCAYVADNIDLPSNYGNLDVSIKYSTDNEAVLTSDGIVGAVTAAGGIEDVTLTAEISRGGLTRTQRFALHIYDKANPEARETAAIHGVIERLERYYYIGELEGLGAVQLYYMPEAVMLSVMQDNGARVIYETALKSGAAADSTASNTEENFVLSADGSSWTMTLNDEVTELILRGAESGFEARIPVNGQTSQNINDNYSRALKIARRLYGEELVVTEKTRDAELGLTGGKTYVNGYRAYALTYDSAPYIKDGVTGISYSLVNNADGAYAIAGGTLGVADANNAPTEIQSVSLAMRFEFNTEPQVVKINIPIRYDLQKKGDGNNIEQFLPYYNYFDRLLAARTNGYTYRDFKMPLGHGVRGAIYYYEVYNADGSRNDNYLDIKLNYSLGGADYVKTTDEVIAMDAGLLQDIMLSGTAEWRISFNVAELPVEDTRLTLRYRYKFYGYAESSWYGAAEPFYESHITVTGIIKPENMHGAGSSVKDYMTDKNLYKYVYDCMRPNKSSPEYVYGGGNYIETHWLTAEFENASGGGALDLSGGKINDAAWSGNGSAVTNYDGLRFLKRVDTLKLVNVGLKRADIDYLTGISIRELSLASNALSDRSTGTLNFPSGRDNGIFTALGAINGLEILHLENNKFYYFTALTKIKQLKEVCVFGNSFDGILSGIVNGIYGTNGALNASTYARLTKNRVIVRNVSETEGYVPYVGDDNSVAMQKAISNLESIAYQRVLLKGESITHAYAGLSANPKDYGIPNMSANHWLLGPADDTLEFGYYDSEAESAAFYALFKYRINSGLGTTWIEVYVDYDVVRI